MLNLYAVHQQEQLAHIVETMKNEMEDTIINISEDSKVLAEKLISVGVGTAQKRAEDIFNTSAEKFNKSLATTIGNLNSPASITKTDNKTARLIYFNTGVSLLALLTLISIFLARYML